MMAGETLAEQEGSRHIILVREQSKTRGKHEGEKGKKRGKLQH